MGGVTLRGYVNDDCKLIFCDPIPREFWGKKVKLIITPTGRPLPTDGSDPCARNDDELDQGEEAN
jgi:hypothetical protein